MFLYRLFRSTAPLRRINLCKNILFNFAKGKKDLYGT